MTPAAVLAAAALLTAAFAAPLWGLALTLRQTGPASSMFQLRARRLAYLVLGAPPLFVLTGVTVGLLHPPMTDKTVWVIAWLAVGAYVLAGSNAAPKPIAGSVARWRVIHGATAAAITVYILFHLGNHLLGLIGPDAHAAMMKAGRHVYRSPVIEPVLIGLVLFQAGTGMRLAARWSAAPGNAHRAFQAASGAYLAAFIITHMNSLFAARVVRKLETG